MVEGPPTNCARHLGILAATALAILAALAALPGGAAAQTPAPAADQTRFSLVGGCYALRSHSTGEYVRKAGDRYVANAQLGGAEPFRMQATALGRYLFYGSARDFLAIRPASAGPAARPSNAADLTVEADGEAFRISNRFTDRRLTVAPDGELRPAVRIPGRAARFDFVAADGCPRYPEVSTSAVGEAAQGSPAYGEVSGFIDGHMHQMAFEFLGGRAHCGRPWHRFGAPYALTDCPDHKPNGIGAVLENTVSYGNPVGTHDPTGWPEFTDWPHHASLTHEQSYYKWLERAWLGGQRIFVNLLVENRVLCELYPLKKNDCDEMKSVRLQAKRMHQLENYIDAQSGGPGKGWYRIVDDPFEARKVINQGKLAVIMGMEVSEPFNCRTWNGSPTCTRADIDRELDALHDLGVRQLEIVNKFDNALTGVAGDSGTTGTLTNTGNFVGTGRFWDLGPCKDPENHDHSPTAVEHNDDLLIANGLKALLPPGALPVYRKGPKCNTRGLTDLGAYAIRRIIAKGMVFDPDHMSVKARNQALDLLEAEDYSGVISSHSWSTPNAMPRIYGLGGVITPYAGDSSGFVEKWKEIKLDYSGRQYFGFGYGADMNGLGSQGGPRTDATKPVSYPFRSYDGAVTLYRQRSGRRVFDINSDGVAHYGLYPDWIEDLRMIAGGKIVRDMARGAEAYLQMWERAEGVGEVRCGGWRGRFRRGGLDRRLRLGTGPKETLFDAGQPVVRKRGWRWCADARKGVRTGKRMVAASFGRTGRVGLIASNVRKHRAGRVAVGARKRKLAKRARRLGGGLWARNAGRGASYVYRTRGGRVRAVGVAERAVASRRGSLRRAFARAGLR